LVVVDSLVAVQRPVLSVVAAAGAVDVQVETVAFVQTVLAVEYLALVVVVETVVAGLEQGIVLVVPLVQTAEAVDPWLERVGAVVLLVESVVVVVLSAKTVADCLLQREFVGRVVVFGVGTAHQLCLESAAVAVELVAAVALEAAVVVVEVAVSVAAVVVVTAVVAVAAQIVLAADVSAPVVVQKPLVAEVVVEAVEVDFGWLKDQCCQFPD